jgi:hypothetical protein
MDVSLSIPSLSKLSMRVAMFAHLYFSSSEFRQMFECQQVPAQGASPLPLPSPSPLAYPTDQSQPVKTGNNWGILSEETIPKIVELRRLLYRHPTTFPNPDIIVQGAKHLCMMEDNSFLEEKLAYLRSVAERDDCQAERQIDGTYMMRSAVSGLPMSPGTLMILGLELGSIESALATTLYPASLYAETDLRRCHAMRPLLRRLSR